MKREDAIKILKDMHRTQEQEQALIAVVGPEWEEMIRIEMVDEIKAILRGEEIECPTQEAFEARLAYLEKQKVQKPEDWEELQAEFRRINEAFENGKKEVVDNPQMYGLCGSTEWSGEDKERIQRIHDFLMNNRKGDTDTIYRIEKDADWLKSIPERFNLQPKQEWGEEDEKLLDAVMDMVANSLYEPLFPRANMLVWLRDLRSRPIKADNWKPTEEQMEQLRSAASLLVGSRAVDMKKQYPALEPLYRELKNRMEGEQ